MTTISRNMLLLAMVLSGCNSSHGAEIPVSETNAFSQKVSFDIHWPLLNPEEKAATQKTALLRGQVTARLAEPAGEKLLLKIVVSLTRPSDETHRQFWNSSLAFPKYDWMRYVRVWDTQQQWLWPNLACLLRASGTERVDRYGGWDPGHQVDNDFAAVLIRKYDASGQESPGTKARPLVSAEWRSEGNPKADRQTIAPTALSDEFVVHLGGKQTAGKGEIRLWLIYADFLRAAIPRGWPKEPEFDGGILAFFRLDWANQPGHECQFGIHQMVPPESTRFDWKQWMNRPTKESEAEAKPRLTEE